MEVFELKLEVVQVDLQELNVGHQGPSHSSSLGVTTVKDIEYHCVYTVYVPANGGSPLHRVCQQM